MNLEKIQALMNSLAELEKTINYASDALRCSRPDQQHLFDRILSYRSIIEKQKYYALKLEQSLKSGDYTDVARHAKLINGLTMMIYEDAKSLSNQSKVADGEVVIEEEIQKPYLC